MATPFLRAMRASIAVLLASASCVNASTEPTLAPITPARVGERAEWQLDAGLFTSANNFDPDLVRIDAEITTPAKRVLRVPLFWFQDFTRELVDGAQVLKPKGEPAWRLRFTAEEPGEHSIVLSVSRPNSPAFATAPIRFAVAAKTTNSATHPAPRGWVRNAADKRSFATADGKPLRLIGANVCWGGPRGTYDFDDWFPAMHTAGENFARLWCAPWSMGLEHTPGTLNRYDLAAAWHLDHVLQLAEENGIYVLLALDHHGMFMANDPAWGGSNNFWTRSSPYAAENGGPCANANEFFTNPAARKLYEKRLRYLVARYGCSPFLLSWQFFNEIDNSYRPRAALVAEDVAAWHRDMGRWLRANDPYQHLISTSLTGASERPELWSLPGWISSCTTRTAKPIPRATSPTSAPHSRNATTSR